jgi:glucose-1-phosphate thymidylyltransferase
MRAIIPVAGVGTRLRPHTYTLPKVLLNVAGKPILAHILDELKDQGINKVTIITGYMGKLVEKYVNERYDMDVAFVEQEEQLGLGHAIWTAKDTFNGDPLLVILGDTIFDVDLKLAFSTGNSSLGVKSVEDPRRFGVVIKDGGKIKKLIEKPDKPISNLALVGIYYLKNADLFKSCLEEIIYNDIKTRGEYQLTDALQLMIEKGEAMDTFPVEAWYDCGKKETLLSTNRYLLDTKSSVRPMKESVILEPSFIADDAVVERSVIGPYATVAAGAVVKDSIVRNSILSDGARVEASLLEQSIIGNDAMVNGQFLSYNVGSSSEINLK